MHYAVVKDYAMVNRELDNSISSQRFKAREAKVKDLGQKYAVNHLKHIPCHAGTHDDQFTNKMTMCFCV